MVNFFIHRPIFASAIAIIMVLAGAIAYFLLPVSQFPDITPPQVVVSAHYPGASAQVVADTVTTPLEQQINGVQGMTYMSSTSSNDGSSTITTNGSVISSLFGTIFYGRIVIELDANGNLTSRTQRGTEEDLCAALAGA